jgi:hypothetical protein
MASMLDFTERTGRWALLLKNLWPPMKSRSENMKSKISATNSTRRQLENLMHKSKLAGFIIDCQTGDILGAANFWGAALGMEVHQWPPEQGDKYVELLDPSGNLHVEVQSVTHPSRVHLDIETDDVEAEVARLERCGAKQIERIKTWVVMEAPTGQRFCVVRVQTKDFSATANTWED